jgi:hypothetical protein
MFAADKQRQSPRSRLGRGPTSCVGYPGTPPAPTAVWPSLIVCEALVPFRHTFFPALYMSSWARWR